MFADAKEKHWMGHMQYRGLAQVTNWVKRKFAATNIKKLAFRRWQDKFGSHALLFLWLKNVKNPACA